MPSYELFLSAFFFLALMLCIQAILFWYRDYQNTKYKFRFYALRDDLALLVLNGTLKETEREYIVLRDAINYSIYASENLSIYQHIKAIISRNTPTLQNSITLRHDETKDIVIDYFINTINLVRKNSWFELRVIESVVHLSKLFSNSDDYDRHNHPYSLPQKAVDQLEENRSKLIAL
jgi:hypothetical protein